MSNQAEIPERSSVTVRSIAIGAALIPVTVMWVVQSEITWYSGEPTTISLFYHTVFILTCLIGVNFLIERISPAKALNPGELLTIYFMICMASVLCGHDMLQILVSLLSYPFWNATPENRWAETILPHIPKWLSVQDRDALRGAYEGDSTMYRMVVLRAWAGPMFWWGTFLCALVGVAMLLNVLLRKQWTEYEKLSYPVIQIPMEITVNRHSLFTNKWMWYGFLLAGAIDLLNGFNTFYPALPKIPIVQVSNLGEYFSDKPWDAIGTTWVSLYPFAIGLCFFLPTDMAFSCWFFFLFWKGQQVLSSWLGVRDMPGFPFIGEQSSGAYLGLAFIALWVSRHYLKQVWNKVVGRTSELDDTDEPLSYRATVIGIAVCMAYLSWFCLEMGVQWWVIILFFLIYFLIAIAIARMRAELGPPAHDLHYGGPDQLLVKWFGGQTLGPPALTFASFTWFFNRAYRGHPMPQTLESLKVAERVGLSSRRMLIAMAIATVIGILAAYWGMLHIFYRYGIHGSLIGPGDVFGREPWIRLHAWLTDPQFQGSDLPRTVASVVGIVQVLVLAACRLWFTWWPFHPVGLAVSSSWSMGMLWFPMFLSWLIKVLMLRYGGAAVYRPAIPFFIGLVLGEFVIGSLWNLIGVAAGVDTYHFWPY